MSWKTELKVFLRDVEGTIRVVCYLFFLLVIYNLAEFFWGQL